MMSLLTPEFLVTMLAALAAALSFVAFALSFLNKQEKKERYRAVIEKKRKDLFQQTKEAAANRNKKAPQQMSASQSVAARYKVQQMLGELGDKIRAQMLQAGIRSPTAPLKFIIARFAVPLILVGFSMLCITRSGKDLSGGLTFLIILVAAFIGYKLPWLIVKNMIQKRSQDISISFPDALDMMLICVQGGIGLEQTIHRIAEEMAEHSETLAQELGILSAEMAMLNDRRAALQGFSRRVGSPAAKTFATALIQAEQYGTSVSAAMRVMSEELRDMRMSEAERKAASLPPKLTVPMILFFLPVIFVVILGPPILQFLDSKKHGPLSRAN
jgi:tight adherence protein C